MVIVEYQRNAPTGSKAMPAIKFAMSIQPEILASVDRAARRQGMNRSAFVASVLQATAAAQDEAEIRARINAFFADKALAAESAELVRQAQNATPADDWQW